MTPGDWVSLCIGIGAIIATLAALVEPGHRRALLVLALSLVGIAIFIAIVAPFESQGTRVTPAPTVLNSQPEPATSGGAVPPGPTLSTSPDSAYQPLYPSREISVPGGSCGGSSFVVFDDSDGPRVIIPGATLPGSVAADVEVTNCPGLTDQHILSQNGPMSTDISNPGRPDECKKAVNQSPDGRDVIPAQDQDICLVTVKGTIVWMHITSLKTFPFQAKMRITAWRPPG